jgi:1-acyl-sn-glycerol-3-phosphate acyltransferase
MSRRPNPLPRVYAWRTNLYHTPMIALSTIGCGSLALAASLFDKSGRWQHRIARFWARLLVGFSSSKLRVVGAENLRKAPVAVYASNHTSYMDTPVIFATLPFQFRILARKNLWSIPFVGWYLNRSGQLPINTENPRATLSSLAHAAHTLRDGMSVFVFPEGGRTQDGHLKPFLSGAAYLAIRAQAPLVPIALKGVYDLMPMHARFLYPGPLTMYVGEPIETKGMNVRDAEALTTELRRRVAALLGGESAALPE